MIEKKTEEYCLYGFRYYEHQSGYVLDRHRVAYTFDEDMNPTRDVSIAKVILLDRCIVMGTDMFFQSLDIKLNGFQIYITQKRKLQEMLNRYPLPRKGISKTTRVDVFAKYNGCCAYCGCELDIHHMQVDHLVPHMDHGGKDEFENYMPSCEICNRVKSAFTIKHFKGIIRHCGEIHRKRKKPMMADSDKIAIKYGLTEVDHEITLYFEKERNNYEKRN